MHSLVTPEAPRLRGALIAMQLLCGGCVAVDDVATTRQGVAVAVPVLANDRFSGASQIVSVTQPAHGTVVIGGSGSIGYTPAPGFVGVDRFSYVGADSEQTSMAEASVVVQPPLSMPGCAFGAFVDGQNPDQGGRVDAARLEELLRLARPYCDSVRFFGLDGDLSFGPWLAKRLGYQTVIATAWIGRSDAVNRSELHKLIGIARYADILAVGSEALLRNDVSPSQLISYMNEVRSAVPGKPVATSEVYHVLLAHPEVIDACDKILAHVHPYWDGLDVGSAVPWIYANYLTLVATAAGKEVIISETGWKSFGPTQGAAVPSPENQRAFLLNLTSFTRATGVSVYYFSTADEPWKGQDDGWGLFTSDLLLKPMLAQVWLGDSVPDNWSREEPTCGLGVPEFRFTFVSALGDGSGIVRGQALHIAPGRYDVVHYILVRGRWWVKPYAATPRSFIGADGTVSADITTGGVDAEATEVRAYVVPKSYSPPIALGWSTLPAELETAAIARGSVTRPDPVILPVVQCAE